VLSLFRSQWFKELFVEWLCQRHEPFNVAMIGFRISGVIGAEPPLVEVARRVPTQIMRCLDGCGTDVLAPWKVDFVNDPGSRCRET
jgi:hypothetical protein